MADVSVISPDDYLGVEAAGGTSTPLFSESISITGSAGTSHVKAPKVFVDMGVSAGGVVGLSHEGSTTASARGSASVTSFVQLQLSSQQAGSGDLVLAQKGVSAQSSVGKLLVLSHVLFNRDPSLYRRWATVAYNKQVFITNEFNPICFTDGVTILHYPNDVPAARYIEIFFDHILLGWPVYQNMAMPSKVMWSDLYRINIFNPAQNNEADSFDFVEWCTPELPLMGVTGLGKIGDVMFVYLPNSICRMRYIGKPKVMQIDSISTDVGNTLMYGLVKTKSKHFFFDGVEGDFFMFDGAEVKPIGGQIRKFFADNISTDFDLIQRTWGYVVHENYEVWWVYVSKYAVGGAFDQAVIYNYKTNAWFTASVNNIHSTIGRTIAPWPASKLTGTADTYGAMLASDLSRISNVGLIPRIYGANNGNVFRDEVPGDANNQMLGQEALVLETKDFYYGDLETVKETESMVIHANADVQVQVSVRDFIDDQVVYNDAKIWAAKQRELGRMGFPRKAGRIVRWKFTPALGQASRNFRWSAFVENIYRRLDEK